MDGLVKEHVYGIQPKFEEDYVTTVYRDFETGTLLTVGEYPQIESIFSMGQQQGKQYVDGVAGQPLDTSLVQAARDKELRYFEEKGVWVRRPREEAYRRTGKRPITVKWIDVNKGDDDAPNYRSRLVAREIRKAGGDPIFAPTPPLESLRTVISLAATDFEWGQGQSEERHERAPDPDIVYRDQPCLLLRLDGPRRPELRRAPS